MNNRKTISFRVKDKGGVSGGKTLSRDIPAFNWESFKNAPNAEEFVRKAYMSAATKIIRDIEENKNGTSTADLGSIEALIVRSLSFTKADIKEWIQTRDWSRAKDVAKIGQLLPIIERLLPEVAMRRNPFNDDVSPRIADKVIAAVADTPDPIADYIFTVLTAERASSISLLEPL